MPKKSNVEPSEIQDLLAKVKNAERVRDDADEKYGYSKALKLYEGDFKSVLPSFMMGIDIIPINEPYAYVKSFIPSVYSRDPFLTVIPKGRKYIIGSKVLELSVNAYWRKNRLKKQIRQCIFDATYFEGWIKVGYSSSLGKVEKKDGEKTVFPSEYIVKDDIFALRVSPKNMVRDPDAVDGIHDARFVAQKIIMPLEAVQATSFYENTDDLKPNFNLNVTSKPDYKGSPEYKSSQQYTVLWEIWDMDEQKVFTIVEGHAKYLMNKKWPYKFNGYPYEMMRFNETFDQPYAPNLISPWLPQLWEKLKLRAMALDHIKRFGRQYWVEKGAMSKMSKDMLKKGITGSVIEMEPGKMGPRAIEYPAIQTDLYAVDKAVDMDKDNVSGQPNVIRSAPQKTQSRTLGELNRITASYESRQSDPQGVVEDFSEEIAKKIINLEQQYFNGEKYLRASSLDIQFLERETKDNPMSDRLDANGFLMRTEDIKNVDFEVEVRAGSTLPLDKKNRIQSMVSITELGERIGIMPGGKVSRVIGKNLMQDFEMPEIIQAYEEELQKMEANEILQQKAKELQLQAAGQNIQRTQQMIHSHRQGPQRPQGGMGGPGGPGMGGGL